MRAFLAATVTVVGAVPAASAASARAISRCATTSTVMTVGQSTFRSRPTQCSGDSRIRRFA
jgi:hypothetical protein